VGKLLPKENERITGRLAPKSLKAETPTLSMSPSINKERFIKKAQNIVEAIITNHSDFLIFMDIRLLILYKNFSIRFFCKKAIKSIINKANKKENMFA
jgi:PP-loop superfamily ATP-utilizing enzyme